MSQTGEIHDQSIESTDNMTLRGMEAAMGLKRIAEGAAAKITGSGDKVRNVYAILVGTIVNFIYFRLLR